MATIDIRTLLSIPPSKDGKEIDGGLDVIMENMLLELRIIALEMQTAITCSQETTPPYRRIMIHYKGKPMAVCAYITFDKVKNLQQRMGKDKICPYQGTSVLPVFEQRKDLDHGSEPLPRYECLKRCRD